MGKWYKEGFKDGRQGMPTDPPYFPGHKAYGEYLEGFKDGAEQWTVDYEAAQAAGEAATAPRTARRVK